MHSNLQWYLLCKYIQSKYVFVSYLVMFVCCHRKFTNQIADQVKKSFLTVCMMRVITFFLREIFDIETRFCGRVRGQNFYNSFYNNLLVYCRGAGMSKILVRTSLYDGHNLPLIRIKVIICKSRGEPFLWNRV